MSSEPTRIYRELGLTVEWRPELCVYCHNCSDGLPAVFDPSRRPWVDLLAAPVAAIREQVSKCPSGALHVAGEPNAL